LDVHTLGETVNGQLKPPAGPLGVLPLVNDVVLDGNCQSLLSEMCLPRTLRTRLLFWLGMAILLNGMIVCCAQWESIPASIRMTVASMTGSGGPGFSVRTHVFSDGTEARVAVFEPYGLSDGRRPLLVYLNGVGKNGTDGVLPLYDGIAPAIWEMRGTFPFVVLFPQCRAGESWAAGGPAMERCLSLIDHAITEYRIDPDRVYLTGISSGGNGVWHGAANHADRFAAVVPISANLSDRRLADAVSRSGIPVWSFCVTADTPELVEANRQMHEALVASGSPALLTEVDAEVSLSANVHNAWDYAFRSAGLYSWLLRQDRSRRPARLRRVAIAPTGDRAEGDHMDPSPEDSQQGVLSDGQALEHLRLESPDEVRVEVLSRGRATVGFLLASGTQRTGGYRMTIASRASDGGEFRALESGKVLGCAASAAEAAFRADQWNDVCVKWTRSRLTVRVNEWTAYDLEIPPGIADDVVLRLFSSAASGSEVEWRNLRVHARSVSGQGAVVRTFPRIAASPSPNALRECIDQWTSRTKRARSLAMRCLPESDGECGWALRRQNTSPPFSKVQSKIWMGESSLVIDAPWCHCNTGFSADGAFDVGESNAHYMKAITHRPLREPARRAFTRYTEATAGRRVDRLMPEDESCALAIETCHAGSFDAPIRSREEGVYRAPLLVYRPFAELGMSIDPGELTMRPAPARVSGTGCIVVEHALPGESRESRVHYFVDPNREYVPLRYVRYEGASVRERADLQYMRGPDGHWQLERWQWNGYDTKGSAVETDWPGMADVPRHAALRVQAQEGGEAGPPRPPSPRETVVRDECEGRGWQLRRQGLQVARLSFAEVSALASGNETRWQQISTSMSAYVLLGTVLSAAWIGVAWKKRGKSGEDRRVDGVSREDVA